EEARRLADEGVEARLAAADGVAEDLARETAAELLAARGDVNHAEERKARVAEVARGDQQ
ncbi:MAG: hypothetical protein V3W36_04265, partial [Acidimicrobiia bacterium]